MRSQRTDGLPWWLLGLAVGGIAATSVAWWVAGGVFALFAVVLAAGALTLVLIEAVRAAKPHEASAAEGLGVILETLAACVPFR